MFRWSVTLSMICSGISVKKRCYFCVLKGKYLSKVSFYPEDFQNSCAPSKYLNLFTEKMLNPLTHKLIPAGTITLPYLEVFVLKRNQKVLTYRDNT